MTPLRRARKAKGWSLEEVVKRLGAIGELADTGNLSRIERGVQRASPDLAEKLCQVFGKRALSELHILYPDRYAEKAA
ncbi:helix-turn-helix transcriptional regulator [Pseudomonas sp.]|uniref:helix-turn-helix domain-containing protein n=1 Tax=Pseudomonas sp. TaxID=306 RepID=UPI002591016D|nr:helix-turn-helix transcriptional regulator [Pseudomonas sp.]